MITRSELHVTSDLTLDVTHIGDGVGPRVCILGGVHGDELEGILSAQRLVAELAHLPVHGTVSVLATANPPAISAGTRLGADDDNLARLFPGLPNGRLSERLAHTIATELVAPCDVLIDLHSAGRRYRMPAMCGLGATATLNGRPLIDVARRMSFPMVWVHPSIGAGRSVSHADELGKPWVYFESGGGGSLSQTNLDLYVDNVLRLLFHVGALSAEPPEQSESCPPQVIVTGGDGDTDAGVICGAAGVFVAAVEAGELVVPQQTIGVIYNRAGAATAVVRSPVSGYVMMLRHEFEVTADDVAAVIAPAEAQL